MHGIIHLEFKRFVENGYGEKAWATLVERAGLRAEIFTPLQAYPDEQIVKLVEVAVTLTERPAVELLEAFGEFLVPTYVSVYGSLLKAEWRTLDVIEHTEDPIHRVVRKRQPGARPPSLKVARVTPQHAVITYDSRRRLCAVARGIVRGLANHFGEQVQLSDQQCMHRGDPACVISVKTLG
jgi:hypothetical protein